MYGADRGIQIRVPADYRHPDLRGRDHFDVHPGIGQRREKRGGHAGVRAHAGADQRHLADVVVEEQALETHFLLYLLQRRQGGRPVAGRQREGDVGAAGALGRHVLHDHVEVGLGQRHGLEDAGRLAGLVRYPDDRDLRLAAVVRDAGDECLFHG